MSRFMRRHRLGVERFSIPSFLLIAAVMAFVWAGPNHAAGKKNPNPPIDEQVSDSVDLDGSPSFEAIIACPAGDDLNGADPGQVLIQSDLGNTTVLKGQQDDDWFGASVAVAGDINVTPNEDFNGDGHADLIVGAPHEFPNGYVYVYYGPFTAGQVLHPQDADMKFFPLDSQVSDFGMSVRQIADVDCDGTPDIGIGGVKPIPGGGTIGIAYVVSGATGDPLYVEEGGVPFNPWLEIVGDAEGDGDVDNIDIAIINRNMGRINPRLTVRDGDFNNDGRITQADKNMALANFGVDHFAVIRGCNNPCPNPPPPGFHCIVDCTGQFVLVPINVWEFCDPFLCPGPGDGVAICPTTGNEGVCESMNYVQCIFERIPFEAWTIPSGGSYWWDFVVGEHAVVFDESFTQSAIFPAQLVDVAAVDLHVLFVGCNGAEDNNEFLSVWIDTDGDGLPDALEEIMAVNYGLDPFVGDSDGNSVPDGQEDSDGDGLSNSQEVALGFWPYDADSDNDGTLDGNENASEGGFKGRGQGGVQPPDCDKSSGIESVIIDGVTHLVTPGEPVYACEGSTITAHISTVGGLDDYWFIGGANPDLAVIVGNPHQDRTSPEYHVVGNGSSGGVDDTGGDFSISVVKLINGVPCHFEVDVILYSINLQIDSKNDSGFAEPTPDDEAVEDQSPGKVIFTGIGDADNDGCPDFADGFDRWPGEQQLDNQSTHALVPLVVEYEAAPEDNVQIRFAYPISAAAQVVPQTYPNFYFDFKPAVEGKFRLWTRDGTLTRSMNDVSSGGHFISTSFPYPITLFDPNRTGRFVVYVEAVRPSEAAGDNMVTATLVLPNCDQSDSIRVTAAEIQVHDLRHWGPQWTSNPLTSDLLDGDADIINQDLWSNIVDSRVHGAITDGVSLCLARFTPKIEPFIQSSLTISRPSMPSMNDSRSLGTLHQALAQHLPIIPTPWPVNIDSLSVTFDTGLAYFVPPESYIAPNGEININEGFYLNFEISTGEVVIARSRFILRRPPLVLVHGILSNPSTWSSVAWGEQNMPTHLPTRHYFVDWGATGSLGYAENYGHVPLMIDNALEEYRSGNDNDHHPDRTFRNLRYAATRADVVAHSQGGQLTRFYVARILPHPETPLANTIAGRNSFWWPNMNVVRDDPHIPRSQMNPAGHWPYIRDDNFGAGSIRRVVTIGSPFDGSPLANIASNYVEPEPQNVIALTGWFNSATNPMPPSLAAILFNATGQYVPPTCAADLCTNSAATNMLALFEWTWGLNNNQHFEAGVGAVYPLGYNKVHWFAMVGVAGAFSGQFPIGTYLDLFAISDLGETFGLGPISSTTWANDGDLIVSDASQRNDGMNGFIRHYNHCHSNPLPGFAETSSSHMASHIRNLLSSYPDNILLPAIGTNGEISSGDESAQFTTFH